MELIKEDVKNVLLIRLEVLTKSLAKHQFVQLILSLIFLETVKNALNTKLHQLIRRSVLQMKTNTNISKSRIT